MKSFAIWPWVLVACFAAFSGACKKKDALADSTAPLQQSFQAAEPEVQKAVQTVTTSLKTGNYAEAAGGMDPIMTRGNLTEQQKQALGVTLQQLNQAVAANPALDTQEMFELRDKITKALTSGPRF
jgi:hypothetical protein